MDSSIACRGYKPRKAKQTMIKRLTLKDWKSFADATLYIDPLTIIIGTNASGKSNTLDALLFLQRIASGVSLFEAINGNVNLRPLRGGMEWVCRKPKRHRFEDFELEVIIGVEKAEYHYKISVQVNGTKAEVFQERLDRLTYGPRSKTPKETRLYSTVGVLDDNVTHASFYTATRGPGKRFDFNRAHAVISQIETMKLRKEILDGTKAVLSHLQSIFVFDPIPAHMRNYSPLSDNLQTDGSNIAGVLAGLAEPRKTEVEKTLTNYLKALPERDVNRVWTEPVGKFQTDAMLYCEEGWEPTNQPQTVDARGMSDGTLRYLSIVTAMLTHEEGSLLVIEEVDNGLHPSRAHILLEMLKELGKERRIDVIVTTHNPAMLDAAGVRMAPFITVAHRDVHTGASQLTLLEVLSNCRN